MAHILAIHGVTPRVDPVQFAFRNLASLDALRSFLASAERFVPLAEAVAGRGDALTIDDATRAAADAAVLARSYGHDVSLFVNPGQVVSGAPHSFLVLNALLDSVDGQSCDFDHETFPTATVKQREALRRRLKAVLQTIADEEVRLSLLTQLASRWRAGTPSVPPHFATLRKEDLITLRDAGVDIQNHGWSHAYHPRLSAKESAGEIRAGRAWLQRELEVEAAYFAVPFGDAWPDPGVTAECGTWLTVMEEWPSGWLAPGVFNRESPTLPEATERA